MKYYLLIFILFTILFNLHSQNCDLPTELPSESELENANRVIAECYAPIIHQMTDNGYANSENGRADLITSVFYDGNYNTGDNWENLEYYLSLPTNEYDALDPVVYYSVVWTNWAWVITYAFYHPRDYSGTDNICCFDNHENDLEGAIFVVSRKNSSNFNAFEVLGAYTISHNDLLHYDYIDYVPEIYVDNGSHAV